MKKSFFVIVCLLLMSSFVFAQNGVQAEAQVGATGEMIPVPEVDISEVKLPSGLQNVATIRVKEEQKLHLEEVLEKIGVKRLEQLNNLRNLQITEEENGEISAEGLEDKRFLGLIKVERKAQFQIRENGDVEKKPRPFDFLFLNDEVIA